MKRTISSPPQDVWLDGSRRYLVYGDSVTYDHSRPISLNVLDLQRRRQHVVVIPPNCAAPPYSTGGITNAHVLLACGRRSLDGFDSYRLLNLRTGTTTELPHELVVDGTTYVVEYSDVGRYWALASPRDGCGGCQVAFNWHTGGMNGASVDDEGSEVLDLDHAAWVGPPRCSPWADEEAGLAYDRPFVLVDEDGGGLFLARCGSRKRRVLDRGFVDDVDMSSHLAVWTSGSQTTYRLRSIKALDVTTGHRFGWAPPPNDGLLYVEVTAAHSVIAFVPRGDCGDGPGGGECGPYDVYERRIPRR